MDASVLSSVLADCIDVSADSVVSADGTLRRYLCDFVNIWPRDISERT